jgi:hypothetical protein
MNKNNNTAKHAYNGMARDRAFPFQAGSLSYRYLEVSSGIQILWAVKILR